MSNSFIRNFTRFQKERNIGTSIDNKVTESVKVIDDRYIVGGVELKQSMINSYIKKVKDDTGQDLTDSFSKNEIAEQLVNYLIGKFGDADSIPASALLGGEEGMEDQVDEVSMEEDDVSVDDEGISEFEEEDIADLEDDSAADLEDDAADLEDSGDDFQDIGDEDTETENEEDIDSDIEDIVTDEEETKEDEDTLEEDEDTLEEDEEDEEDEDELPL